MSIDARFSGRSVITAHSRTRDAWVSLHWPGQTDPHEEILPDGRHVYDAIRQGDLAPLTGGWAEVYNTGAYRDMLWAGGLAHAIVSDAFLQTLVSNEIAGYRSLPIEVQPKRGDRFGGYHLLAPTDVDPHGDIRSFPAEHRPTWSLDISDRLLALLTDAGASDFACEPAAEAAARLAEVDCDDASSSQ